MSATVQRRGTVTFDPASESWSRSGDGWNLASPSGTHTRVVFDEPLAFGASGELAPADYSLSVTPLGSTPSGLQLVVKNVAQDGFDLSWICDDPAGISQPLRAAFTAQGVQANPVPDDRELDKEDSIADLHAARMVYGYEAKYGTVSVMSSASINSKDDTQAAIDQLAQNIAQLSAALEQTVDPVQQASLKEKLRDARTKKERRERILKNSVRYWDSAQRFGELWGDYAANQQNDALGGRYVPVCTGGGPGIMYAVATGARSKNAQVLGLDTLFGNDEFHNLAGDYTLPSNIRLRMNDFGIRESMLINYSNVILFWPGGYGTAWEVCETLSKIQTMRLRKRRIKAIFVHSEYWQPFFDLVAHMREFGTVNAYGDRIRIPGVDDQLPDDAYIAEVVDTPEDAFEMARAFVEQLYKDGQLVLGGCA